MAEGGTPLHVNNHAHKCEQILKVNGTKVLRKLLEDRVNKKWQFPIEELLSANSANGTLREKCHQLRQLFDNQKFNPSESYKIKAGINEFDISLLTKLLKNPRVSGINVTEGSWKTLGGETVAFMFCPNIPGTSQDDEDMKLAGLVCVLQFYRNNIIGHDTYCSEKQGSEYFTVADEHIRRAVKEIAEILKLPATELKFENTMILKEKYFQNIKKNVDEIQAENNSSTKDSRKKWPPKAAIHDWRALMIKKDIVPEPINEYMQTLPDYIPLKLLSIPGQTALSKDQLNSCLESGVRLFKLNSGDNISGVLDQISQYLDKYGSETVIIWVAANNCSPLNRLERLDFNKHKELKDVRGKILVLDINHFGNQDHVKVYDKRRQSDADWDEIQAHIQHCGRYDTIDNIKREDFVITVLGTESTTGNMQHLLYKNKELISCGGMMLMDNIPLSTAMTNQILSISQRFKCMVEEIVSKDTRLPKLSISDKSKTSRIKKFVEGFTPYQTALIEASPAIRIVLDEELSQNSDYYYFTSFLDQLITSLEHEARMIIDMVQYAQILLYYYQYGANLALSSLLAVMQKKGADDIDDFIQALGVDSLIYYVKDLIQECSKLNRLHNNNTCNSNEQIQRKQIAVKLVTKQSHHGSVGNLNPNDLLQKDPSAFTTNVTDCLGSNLRAVDGCIEIQMEVNDEWQFENLKKSVEHGVFLDSYCAWLRANGKTIKEEEEVKLSVTFNGEVYSFPVQKTPTEKPKIKPTPQNWIVHVFMHVAPKVEFEWKRLATYLGFDDVHILRFQQMYQKVSDSILQMLIEWKLKMREKDSDLLEKFITALCDCDLQHLLKDVETHITAWILHGVNNKLIKMAEEPEERTDDISDEQIHQSLHYVKSDAVKKLTRNNSVTELRAKLWEKELLSRDEFVMLGTTFDEEGPLGMSQKLIDLMLEKKDQQCKFLQEIQALDPEVHELTIENRDIEQKIADHIKVTYSKRKCHLVQALPGETLQLDLHRAEYVMPLVITAEKLKIHDRHEHFVPQGELKHEYKKVECNDIEQIVVNMIRDLKSVCLCTGIAGVGKTICTKKIVTGWVDGEFLLQDYNIVLAIPVREVNINRSIIDMIGGEQGGLGLINDNTKEIFDHCLMNESFASKVLMLIDGIDECDITADTELYQLITGKKYPYVKKLITARPEASLLSELKSFFPDYKITIHGTSQKGVYTYLKEVMTDEHTKPSNVEIDKLIMKCQQEMVEFDLLLIPLYLSLVGFVFNFHWAQYCTFTNFTIPKTTTRLFSSFLTVLVRIWLKKIGREDEAEKIRFDINPIGRKSTIPKDIKKILIFSFGKISYDFIQQQKYTMTQTDLENYLIEIDDIEQSGMFGMGQEQGEKIYSFRHKTLQDYMAALYLSHIRFDDHTFTANINMISAAKHSSFSTSKAQTLLQVFPKLSLVVKFLFGLEPDLCRKLIDKLSGCVCIMESSPFKIKLDYEASLFSEVEDPHLLKTFLDELASARVLQNHVLKSENGLSVFNLCKAFSEEQRISVLNNWYNLHLHQQGHEWILSCKNSLSDTEPNNVLCIDYLTQVLCMLLINYQFKHIQSLEIKGSDTADIGLIERIFPKLESINLVCSGLKNVKTSIDDLLMQSYSSTPISSGSNLKTIILDADNSTLPLSSVESLTQQAGLNSVTLSGLDEILPLWDIASRGLVSWTHVKVLKISVFRLTEMRKFVDFLKNYTPELTVLTVSNDIGNDEGFSLTELIHSMLTSPFSKLTELRLFGILKSEGVLSLCENLPLHLHTLGVGCNEVKEVTDKLMDTLCLQCPQVEHLYIGYGKSYEKSKAENVSKKLISHRTSQHANSNIQVGLYDYVHLKCTSDS